jgi:hypothetical protein
MIKVNELRIGNYVGGLFDTEQVSVIKAITENDFSYERISDEEYFIGNSIKPIPLTEEWLLKFGFENWGNGKLYASKYETYDRFVLFNVIDGTSNFEVHSVISTHGNTPYQQFIISCDEDDRINWGIDLKYINQLQNLYFALTGQELMLKNK